jgi:hypothetical protein
MTPARRDLATTLAALAALLAWDASGADLAEARLFANASGFALRVFITCPHRRLRWKSERWRDNIDKSDCTRPGLLRCGFSKGK